MKDKSLQQNTKKLALFLDKEAVWAAGNWKALAYCLGWFGSKFISTTYELGDLDTLLFLSLTFLFKWGNNIFEYSSSWKRLNEMTHVMHGRHITSTQ